MERLTTRLKSGRTILMGNISQIFNPKIGRFCEGKAVDKLAEYEDAEEKGLLLRLPCKVGDVVYDNIWGKTCANTIKAFSFGECDDYIAPVTDKEIVFYSSNSSGSINYSFAISEIGKTVFLTRKEAEAKLAEMRGEQHE